MIYIAEWPARRKRGVEGEGERRERRGKSKWSGKTRGVDWVEWRGRRGKKEKEEDEEYKNGVRVGNLVLPVDGPAGG